MGYCPSGGGSVTHLLGRRRGSERDCDGDAAKAGYDDEGGDDDGGGRGCYRRQAGSGAAPYRQASDQRPGKGVGLRRIGALGEPLSLGPRLKFGFRLSQVMDLGNRIEPGDALILSVFGRSAVLRRRG